MKVILASASPRRQALLQQIGITPLVCPADFAEGSGCILVIDGKACNLAPGGGELPDLPQRAFDIRCAGVEHRLDGDRRAAYDFYRTDGNLFCHLYHLLCEKFPDILERDECHKRQQQDHARRVDIALKL